MDRCQIAALICARIREASAVHRANYRATESAIGYFVIDDLLPPDLAKSISASFPEKDAMTCKRSIRERKAIMAKMAECAPIIGETVYAFHDLAIVRAIADITGAQDVMPDPLLYAGGISAMGRGDFLNPHLDNSHDRDRERWRAFNLLYYVTPDWPDDCGGNLELWPDGVGGKPIAIHSRFNRLVVMATHGQSWHSVSPVTCDSVRMCVSNYFFTPAPLRETDRFHITSFRGRPGHGVSDAVLRADALARSAIRRVKPNGIAPVTHLNA